MKRPHRRYRRQTCPKIQGSPEVVKFKPRQFQKGQILPLRASLEGVAIEIQQIILHQMPDLPALQALISASTSYSRAYQSQRHSILSDILLRDIHADVLFDVLAIVDPLKLPQRHSDNVPHLKACIEQFEFTRPSLDIALEPLEPSTRETLLGFHLAVVDITKECCNYALSTHPVTDHGLNHSTSLSPNEVRRIHRAFYRYELFTVLFREMKSYQAEQAERHRDRDRDRFCIAFKRNPIKSLDTPDKSWIFLALYKTWEMEAIACVRDYIMHWYDELYRICTSEFQEMIEKESNNGAAP